MQRLSPGLLKLSLAVLAAAPLIDLVMLTALGRLGTNPQETLLRATGTWCLVLLLTTLAVTPLRRWLAWPELISLRRMLGLWTFSYAVIHLMGFWAFEHDFVVSEVFRDALKRPFVTVGLVSLLLMLPLALTSNNWSMRTLGVRWKTVHRLIYLIALLACLHFFLHKAGKNDFTDPSIALVVTLALLGARLIRSGAVPRQ
jgi:sulfoxide reductase heme-binding subunit YedZ